MGSLGTAVLDLDTDNSKLDRGLDRAESKTTGAVGGFSKAGVAIGAAFVGVGLAAKNAWDELANAQKVGAQTDAVLKSTGGVAGVTKKNVEDLAGSISDYSGLDDELVQSGANMLLTFTKVRNGVGANNQIFDRATRAIADVSVGLGKDLPGSAVLVGKALNDPLKGMTALGRAGVQFTQAQKDAITAMVNSGNTAGAQRLILKELETQFGGSAKAAGNTLPGQLAKARNAFDNLSADILAKVLPVLLSFASMIQTVVGWLQRNSAVVLPVIAALGTMAAIITVVIGATWAWTTAMAALNAIMLLNPIVLIVVLIAGLVAAVIVAYRESETFRNILQAVWSAVRSATSSAVNFIVGLFNTLKNAINAVIDWVRNNWPAIALIISGPFAPLVALATDAFGIRSAIVGAFRSMLSSVRDILGDVITAITNLWGKARTAAETIGQNVWNGIKDGLSALGGLYAELWSRISGAISNAAGAAAGAAAAVGRAIVDGILAGSGNLLSRLKSWLESQVKGALSSLNPFSPVEHGGQVFIGEPIVDGAVAGLDGMSGRLNASITDQLRAAIHGVRVPGGSTGMVGGGNGGSGPLRSISGGMRGAGVVVNIGTVIGAGNERVLARELTRIIEPEMNRRVSLGRSA